MVETLAESRNNSAYKQEEGAATSKYQDLKVDKKERYEPASTSPKNQLKKLLEIAGLEKTSDAPYPSS